MCILSVLTISEASILWECSALSPVHVSDFVENKAYAFKSEDPMADMKLVIIESIHVLAHLFVLLRDLCLMKQWNGGKVNNLRVNGCRDICRFVEIGQKVIMRITEPNLISRDV